MREKTDKAVAEDKNLALALDALGKSIARWTDKKDLFEGTIPGL
jgi:hypothetical protein